MKSISLDTPEVPPFSVLSGPETETGRKVISVVTRMPFHLRSEEVWDGLMFYEQIRERPPLLLRLLLPTPAGAEGCKPELGEQVRCFYTTGYLVKAITHIDHGHKLAFRVIEQKIQFGGGIKLVGGHYALAGMPGGITEVSLSTEYLGSRQPRWFWERGEAAICHSFHRFILREMRSNLGA